jgi:phage virion morphogenesis protein
MAGAGLEVELDGEYQKIIEALQKASSPALQRIAHAGGQALKDVSKEAFQKQADPATGEKWKERKDKSITRKLLVQRGTLLGSISMNAFPDGSAIIGSNMVYARIHQEGGKTKAHDIKPRNGKALRFNGICRGLVHHPGSEIPARPYLGVPKDFERQFFDDPAIKELLGMAGGG